jgi:hypothetical protein
MSVSIFEILRAVDREFPRTTTVLTLVAMSWTVVIKVGLEERSCNRLIRFELPWLELSLPHSAPFRIVGVS